MGTEGRPDIDPRWRRASGWVDRVVGKQVMVKGRHGEDRTLGGLAAAVWIVLDRPAGRNDLVERIAEQWPGPTVADDAVDEALGLLTANDLVVETDHPAG